MDQRSIGHVCHRRSHLSQSNPEATNDRHTISSHDSQSCVCQSRGHQRARVCLSAPHPSSLPPPPPPAHTLRQTRSDSTCHRGGVTALPGGGGVPAVQSSSSACIACANAELSCGWKHSRNGAPTSSCTHAHSSSSHRRSNTCRQVALGVQTHAAKVALRVQTHMRWLGGGGWARLPPRTSQLQPITAALPRRSHPQYFVTRTGVTSVNLSQNGPHQRWKRLAHIDGLQLDTRFSSVIMARATCIAARAQDIAGISSAVPACSKLVLAVNLDRLADSQSWPRRRTHHQTPATPLWFAPQPAVGGCAGQTRRWDRALE
jgi:hypothetical protein